MIMLHTAVFLGRIHMRLRSVTASAVHKTSMPPALVSAMQSANDSTLALLFTFMRTWPAKLRMQSDLTFQLAVSKKKLDSVPEIPLAYTDRVGTVKQWKQAKAAVVDSQHNGSTPSTTITKQPISLRAYIPSNPSPDGAALAASSFPVHGCGSDLCVCPPNLRVLLVFMTNHCELPQAEAFAAKVKSSERLQLLFNSASSKALFMLQQLLREEMDYAQVKGRFTRQQLSVDTIALSLEQQLAADGAGVLTTRPNPLLSLLPLESRRALALWLFVRFLLLNRDMSISPAVLLTAEMIVHLLPTDRLGFDLVYTTWKMTRSCTAAQCAALQELVEQCEKNMRPALPLGCGYKARTEDRKWKVGCRCASQ